MALTKHAIRRFRQRAAHHLSWRQAEATLADLARRVVLPLDGAAQTTYQGLPILLVAYQGIVVTVETDNAQLIQTRRPPRPHAYRRDHRQHWTAEADFA